jgi:hypothetical protein
MPVIHDIDNVNKVWVISDITIYICYTYYLRNVSMQ